MAYVSVSEWRPEQVTEWLKGLDICVTPYLHWFSNNEVNGQQLLNLSPDELSHLGVHKIGHQELILDAVEHLRNFHYELDRENLQLLALRVSCAAHSLYNEIKHKGETSSVPTQTMADVSNVISHVKPLVSWLDRPPFSGQIEYDDYKSQLLRISLEMATCAQRDTFAERPISEIRNCSSKLAKLADSIIQDIKDPMLLQPASLDLATIKKRVGEDLGFFLIPSFHGIHQISDMKLSSPAHQSGKIQPGDEVVQVNYQTVVAWSRKKVLALFDESPNDLLLTLKRRPRHVKMYGQIYMKPYRLPSRKRASPYSRWNDNVQSPRPDLLALPHFDIPRVPPTTEKSKNEDILSEPSVTSSSSDEEFGRTTDSQNSVSLRLYLPKPRAPIQRRFTLSGPPRPSAQSEQFWRELQLERSWRSNQNNSQMNNSNSEKLGKDEGNVDEMFQLRDKSASLGNSIAAPPTRPSTCINFSKSKIGNVKFDLPKVELASFGSGPSDKSTAEERERPRKEEALPTAKGNEGSGGNFVPELVNDTVVSNGKMTISEMNKMKRDAFFGNMDGSSGVAPITSTEDSSEKVKRIIENFKSDVNNIRMEVSDPDIVPTPGKVSRLIGSFERKEMEQTGRSKLDKDGSRFGKGGKTKESNHAKGTNRDGKLREKTLESGIEENDSSADVKKSADVPEETHGKIVNTINNCLHSDRDFYGRKEFKQDCQRFDEDDDISNGSDFEYQSREEAREIVDTVGLALVELKQVEDHYDVRDMGLGDQGKEIGSSSSSSSSSRLSTERSCPAAPKPIPTERKSKMQPCLVGPLPPKPRPRTTERSRTPPQPPPRPESTLPKPRKEACDPSSLPLPAMAGDDGSQSADQKLPSQSSPLRELRTHSRGPPVLSVVTEKPKSSGGTLESLKAMLSLGRKPLSFNSPRSVRKKNALLARKRNVGVKDVSPCENSGSLWHRNRKGTAAAPWSKFFFVLQGPNFYGFKSKDSQKADLFIHLPGFTCTLAEEVKSKEFAFKIYHTGTAFYFAANSREDLQQWLDSVSLATICSDEKQAPETITFSVSDSDLSDPEIEPETCFPTSPKMKKFLGSSPVPKPARSHQNLASDSKKTYDIQKRFGSLKKLSSQKHSSPNQSFGSGDSGNSSNSEIASLDRKYLRFLGHKNTPLPVPTSQFRSYRRMQPSATTTAIHGKINEKNEMSLKGQQQLTTDQPGLVRKALHMSNPSLIHPDMADYRVTQERLAEFRRLRNQEHMQETSGFPTLEQLMTSRQEEDSLVRSNRSRPPELRGFMTLEQFLLRQEEERMLANRPNRIREKPHVSETMTEHSAEQEEDGPRSGIGKITKSSPRGDATEKENHRTRTSENPHAKPRGSFTAAKHGAIKVKAPWKITEASGASAFAGTSREVEECSCASCEASLLHSVTRKNNSKKQSDEDEATAPDCPHLCSDPTPDYPGLEYPPAFEPETYTLQYMLKNRRKRAADKSKKDEK